MKTHLDIDGEVLSKVMTLGGFKTKRAAVNAALQHYLNLLRREKLINLCGKVRWDADLDVLRSDRTQKPN